MFINTLKSEILSEEFSSDNIRDVLQITLKWKHDKLLLKFISPEEIEDIEKYLLEIRVSVRLSKTSSNIDDFEEILT